jgi:pimeloyl-ACP methyl ester carboxylesterase
MQPPKRALLAALIGASAWVWACAPASLGTIAPAAAQIAYTPCGDTNDFACGHLTVPLDPSGVQPGTITLAIRRHRSAVGEAHTAIVALAGGPGQPALPFAEQFDELLGPIAATRDLITFDQRGIGLSAPLSCHAFERPGLYHSFGALIEACGDQLGPDRAFYTTADTVADIEAIRQAGGYEKLVLYGTSYGTKVAEEYAQRYPSHVEALVLDSVVPPNGPDPLDRSTYAAIPRILRQICAEGECAQTTGNPVADLTTVLEHMAHGPLRVRAIGAGGKTHAFALSPEALYGMLLAGDFSSLLRSEFVTAVAAAARGDDAPIARFFYVAANAEGEGQEDFDNPLFYATSCEEQDFPFSRSSSPAERLAQADAAARALGASAFAPFNAADAIETGDVPSCAYWPYTGPAAPADEAPLPNVPTLILSGADDLRTPTANAREVAAQIPDAHLLVVPYTGHSVLGDEPTSCASNALQALFNGKPVKSCPAAPPPPELVPAPLPPPRLADVAPAPHYKGLTGRALRAVGLTLQDFGRQLVLQLTLAGSLESLIASKLDVGGLRAGWAQYANGALVLHDYSYVPGVTISGSIRAGAEDLRISGSSGAHGLLQGEPHKALSGTLDGGHVVLAPSLIASAAIVGSDALESTHHGAGSAAASSVARQLDRLLGGIQP